MKVKAKLLFSINNQFVKHDIVTAYTHIAWTSAKGPNYLCELAGNREYIPAIALDIVDNPNEINWEQRRYELAKSIVSGIVSRPSSIQIKEDCTVAIEMADEMIKQLKEE